MILAKEESNNSTLEIDTLIVLLFGSVFITPMEASCFLGAGGHMLFQFTSMDSVLLERAARWQRDQRKVWR